jgi:DNA-binding LacI/PurR family transcriptional regulator
LDYSHSVISETATQVMLSPLPKGGGGRRRDEMVEQYLLEKITSGELPVGTKLPPTSEMSVQMQVNVNSMQKALMRLSARGFLARRTNLGTFVCPRDLAPLNIFLLVGPCLRDEWCHFDRRFSKLIEAELFSRGYNPILYDGLDQILDHTSSIGPRLMSQLLADYTHFDPKAIVEQGFVSLRLPELARDGKRPIVSFRPIAQGGDVAFDSAHFYTEAVRATVERGRKNAILVLKNPKISFDSPDLQAFWNASRTHGLNVVKVLHIDDDHTEGVREHALEDLLTQELRDWKKLPPSKRWDSLILRDDIQMRTAAQCLLREGISVPHDIMALSSVNEGVDLEFGIPSVGIEMPLAQAASSLVDILDVRLGQSTDSDPAPVSLQGRIVEVGRQAVPIPQRLEPADLAEKTMLSTAGQRAF